MPVRTGCPEARLIELLSRKRLELERYSRLLRLQGRAVRDGDASRVEEYTRLGEDILSRLQAVQKSIDPLATMTGSAYSDDTGREELEAGIEDLLSVVRHEVEENRRMLAEGMSRVRRELSSLRLPRGNRSSYRQEDPRFFDISG